MQDCLVSFGSNLGDSHKIVSDALDNLRDQLQGLQSQSISFRVSPFYVTRPVGGPPGQSAFINGAVRFRSERSPVEILEVLHHVERDFGRERRVRWDSRTLDLDLLLYGEETFDAPGIRIPHPRMSCRQFVLQPASQIAGDMRHPVCGVTLEWLLNCVEKRKSDILLVSTPARAIDLKTLVESLSAQAAITMVTTENLSALTQETSEYKLIAFDLKENQHKPREKQPREFSEPVKSVISWQQGPILFLENESVEQIQIELKAAMDAMKAI